MLKRTRDFENC